MSEKMRPEWLAKRVEDGYYEEDGGFMSEWFLNDLNSIIKSACVEAVQNDRDERTAQDLYKHSFSSGYARGREDAAKVCEKSCKCEFKSGEFPVYVSDLIRSLTPPEEAK